MKKLAVVLMVAGMLLVTGCGNNEKVIDGNVKNQGSGSVQQQGSGTQTQAKGYVFVSGSTTVEIDALAAPIIEKLGEPASYYEAASCAFEGLDKMYTYQGFELDTYPTEDKDYVSAVIFKDDSVKTPEGIGIGDTAKKVEEVYGSATKGTGSLEYSKDGMKLCFIVKDDEVVSVEYRTTVLDN